MSIANFAKALAPVLLIAATGGGGGGTAAASGSKGSGGTSLADSFLMATGAMPFGKDTTAVTPFTAPTPAMRARSLGQMGLGSRGSGQAVRLTPAQRMMASNVDIRTAATAMMANATNPEFRDFARKYASPAVFELRRKPKVTLDAPGDIEVKTTSA